jgi:2-dehydro-3-deoxygalactonokinase
VSEGAFIAVDWGTTNRRAYLFRDGVMDRTVSDGHGILAMQADEYGASIARLREELGDFPLLLAGMVGSNRGWRDAGYIGCPATLVMLASRIIHIPERIALAPGVSFISGGRADVMRGEEVQLLGAVSAGMAPGDALLCQPGTHCKWARMLGGAIASFVSVMTGEMFALLRSNALIGSLMGGPVTDSPAFREGVARAGEQDLLAALFGVRPASLLGLRDEGTAASYVSGLLIGSDCRAQVGKNDQVFVLADTKLGSLYSAAIEEIGGKAILLDSHAAFCAGITNIWDLIQ